MVLYSLQKEDHSSLDYNYLLITFFLLIIYNHEFCVKVEAFVRRSVDRKLLTQIPTKQLHVVSRRILMSVV